MLIGSDEFPCQGRCVRVGGGVHTDRHMAELFSTGRKSMLPFMAGLPCPPPHAGREEYYSIIPSLQVRLCPLIFCQKFFAASGHPSPLAAPESCSGSELPWGVPSLPFSSVLFYLLPFSLCLLPHSPVPPCGISPQLFLLSVSFSSQEIPLFNKMLLSKEHKENVITEQRTINRRKFPNSKFYFPKCHMSIRV